MSDVFSTVDPLSRRIVLSTGTWNSHIIIGHPELSGREGVVKKAVERPEYILSDPNHARRQQYFDIMIEPNTNSLAVLKVVVEFSSTGNGRVVTSYSPGKLHNQASFQGGLIYERQ